MTLKALRSSLFVMGVFALVVIHLPSASAQSGQVAPPNLGTIPLNFSQTRVVEGDGTAIVNVQLTLAFNNQTGADLWDPNRPLTVSFTTRNRTATAGTCGTGGADYVALSTFFQFTGQLSQTTTMQVCSDELSEGDEQFELVFTVTENHPNYGVSIQPSPNGVVTITDDEPLPALSITPAIQVAEPSSGTASATFTVSLSGPINQRPVTVDFATGPGTAAAGTTCPRSSENVDYLTKAGTLTFSPPSNLLQSPQIPRTQRVTVSVCSDSNRIEGPETFFVNLTRPVNATLTAGGTVTSLTSPKLSVTRGTATIN